MSDAIDRLRKLAAKLADSPQYADQQAKIRCPGDDDQAARGRLAFESGILGHRCTSAADEIAMIIRLLETP